MLLIYNTIQDEQGRLYFDRIVRERLFPEFELEIVYLKDKIASPDKYSHLLLTGSELSASQGSEYDVYIFEVIEHFVKSEKPVLAICHGHQMLARYLAGDQYCRRSREPEFGFKKMEVQKDELFAGIINPVFLESRYDEVFHLPEEFRILAANEAEAIQSFRYRDLPFWGVQFHPEFFYEDGEAMLQKHLAQRPQERKYYRNDLTDKNVLKQNMKIFSNFINC